jgi:hypothetical protein
MVIQLLSVTLEWSMEPFGKQAKQFRVADGPSTTENKLLKDFPPITPTLKLTSPAVVVDKDDNIAMIYAPGLYTPRIQVCQTLTQ